MSMKLLLFMSALGFTSSAFASQSLWLCQVKDVNLGARHRLTEGLKDRLPSCKPKIANPILLDDKQPRFMVLPYERISDGMPKGLFIQLTRSLDQLSANITVDGNSTELGTISGKSFNFKAEAPRGDGYEASGRVECEPITKNYMFTHIGMVDIGEPASFDIAVFEAMKCDPGAPRSDLMIELERVCLNGSVYEAFNALSVSRLFTAKSTLAIESGKLTYKQDDFICTGTRKGVSGDFDKYCSEGYTVSNGRSVVISNCN